MMNNKRFVNNEIRLYRYDAPGSEGISLDEHYFVEEMDDGQKKYLAIHTLNPTIIPYIPENPNDKCIMIIPGGGYRRQVMSKEGSEIALWLNSLNITAFVLKHRMPNDGHKEGVDVPLQDASRGIRLIRSLANQYGYDQNQVGVMGFSAGAHVAGILSTNFNKSVYTTIDDIDSISARPAFSVLCYPPINIESYKEVLDINSNDFPMHARDNVQLMMKYGIDTQVSELTPSTFIVVADDDMVTPSENSIRYYQSLRKHNIDVELHIFKEGGHGFGLGIGRGQVESWTKLFVNWLETL